MRYMAAVLVLFCTPMLLVGQDSSPGPVSDKAKKSQEI
jgi:hypothetical protein